MQIVIDIDAYVLEHCRRHAREHYANNIEEAIANGTPLPKGHGRLIDANKAFVLLNEQIDKHDKMMAKYEPYSNNQIPLWWWKVVCRESTVIEADTKNT